ncbi:hypothetical protein P8631_07410 [Guyparkeria sp. 1SP6A2]|nr:hypothetical protein [Guyparkeria sp. 1SP6A2]
MKNSMISTAVVAVFSLGLALPGISHAQESVGQNSVGQGQPAMPIYGSQLMTEQERLEYRERMRSAQSAEESQRIRSEHHERMEQRARERGVALPEEPPRGGQGMGGGMNQMNDLQRMEERERLRDSRGDGDRSRMREERQDRMHEQMPGMDSDDRRRGTGMGSGGGGSRY